jgi:spoIIIJ-associated protein
MEKNKEKLNIVENTTKKLLDLFGVEAKIEEIKEEDNIITVQIETKEPGILIGYHGGTLFSLQLILELIVSKKIGEWTKVVVNIGDYRQKREEILKKMALSFTQKVLFSGEPVVLPPLSPQDRRVIHLFLRDHPDVFSESEGEGENRRLVIKPRRKIKR